jgi:predicted ATPase
MLYVYTCGDNTFLGSQVTDVSDALLLGQIFEELWKRGVVMILTSNRPPGDLYQPGFNKTYFQRFIALLEHRCYVQRIGTVEDYRQALSLQGNSSDIESSMRRMIGQAYFCLHEDSNDTDQLDSLLPLFRHLLSLDSSGSIPSCDIQLKQSKRKLHVERGCPLLLKDVNQEKSTYSAGGVSGICLFTFKELCCSDIGAADYKAICDHFHTVLLTGVPIMQEKDHDKARRFITLIDEL